jgi:hypothetical protein
MLPEPPSPWKEFLTEIDALLREDVSLHCIGGFVISAHYGLPRPTGDIDYVSVYPNKCDAYLNEIAGIGSPLSNKHKLYLQRVGVTTMPDNYEMRLTEIFPGLFANLKLCVPDPYDLLLSKVERNSPKDRYDVEFLGRTLLLDQDIFRERYQTELRPYLANEERHDLTIRLWIESCFQSPDSIGKD